MRRRSVLFLAASLLLASLRPLPVVAEVNDPFVDASGQPAFLTGANYEGPADRAWQMWSDNYFDLRLIDQDFARAQQAKLSLLRIFVQRPLAEELRAKHFNKLDRVLDLADRHALRLIVTFADELQIDLAKTVAVEHAVAARYAGRPTIFAYDLKNEPHFGDLAGLQYPAGVEAAIQQPALVPALGEEVALEDIAAYRSSGVGAREVPPRFDDEQAYAFVNVVAAYRRFVTAADAWSVEHRADTLRYLRSPDSASWQPLLEALNDTYAAWLAPQLDALRASDPGRPVTVGQADLILASLPVNDWLDFRSFHLYPSANPAALERNLALFDELRLDIPQRPLMLEEFGISNVDVDEATSASLEAQLISGVRDRGGVAALKWMLNDFPGGADPRQNAYGMYRADGTAKPIVSWFQQFD